MLAQPVFRADSGLVRSRSAVIAAMVAAGTGNSACKSDDLTPVDAWNPGEVYASVAAADTRGFIDRRGLIHAHSIHSHDACDGEPRIDGKPDLVCLDDFRRGLCQSGHDFVMLTDHNDLFGETEWLDALLHDPRRGDKTVEHEGAVTASWMACPDGTHRLVMAGTESGTMPVGLERHVADDRAERGRIYRSATADAMNTFKATGAIVLAQHTEDWSVDQLSSMPFDGFEIYNLHANTLLGAGPVLELLFRVTEKLPGLPHPDLALLPIFSEDARYLDRWSKVLARDVKRIGTMGTDCHRNTFPALLEDGERIDSYRRMMTWFSNHVRIRTSDGVWDDRALKEALRSGRSYGVFEVLGYPEGFDFRAESGATTIEIGEMGDVVAMGAELIVTQPKLRNLDPAVSAPRLTTRLLRATEDGWVEVATSDGDIAMTASVPGAYRAEIRMTPRHLRTYLGDWEELAVVGDFVWIYANPIYVR